MNKEINYKLYDEIISSTYMNILNSSYNNKIILNSFIHTSPIDKVFLKVSFMVANFSNKKIYLNCKLSTYFKILFKNYSKKQIFTHKYPLRWTRHEHDKGIDIIQLSRIIVKDFNKNISIFSDIWDTYYEDKDENICD